MSAAVALALAAGLLAPVNPCGFALLPGFLAAYLGSGEASSPRAALERGREGLLVGVTLGASFASVFVAAGFAVSIGLRPLLDLVPWLALVLGAGLALLGLAMLAGRHVALVRVSGIWPKSASAQGYQCIAVFGAGYALASLACTLPLFLAVVGQALAAAGPLQLVAVFAAYAIGATGLFVALSLSAAMAKGALARVVRRALPVIDRLAGALVVTSGVYLLLYWLSTLGRGGASDWVGKVATAVSGMLATSLAAHPRIIVLALAVVVVLSVAFAWPTRRQPSPDQIFPTNRDSSTNRHREADRVGL